MIPFLTDGHKYCHSRTTIPGNVVWSTTLMSVVENSYHIIGIGGVNDCRVSNFKEEQL